MANFQVVIYINEFPITMSSPEVLVAYVEAQRKQVKDWVKYDHLPLLKVVYQKTGESFEYPKIKDLPKLTVKSKDGKPLIIIKNGRNRK